MSEAAGPCLAIIADPHVGNHKAHGGEMVAGLNDRGRLSLETFRRAIRMAKEAGAVAVAVAGDLVLVRRPEPAIIAGLQRVLEEETQELPTILVPGNHDMLDASAEAGNTACAPLYRETTITNEPCWLEPPGLQAALLCVPFNAEMPMREYLEKMIAKHGGHQRGRVAEQRVLITHVGVYDDESPTWCRDARDAIHADKLADLMADANIGYAFVGNFHNHQVWNSNYDEDARIVQVGTLCPGGHGDSGEFPRVGGMALYRPGQGHEMVEVPGPRFVDQPAEVRTDEGYHHFVRPLVIVAESEMPAEALPQAEDAMSAIDDFLGEMKLPPDIDRGQAMELVRSYWQRS